MAEFNEILNQYNQLRLLIDRMHEFTDRCCHHVVKEPVYKLEEAIRYGFPVDVAKYYLQVYQDKNRMEAEAVIQIINERCIPYLEGKLAHLKGILDLLQQ